jgi:CHAD domain-containing protein
VAKLRRIKGLAPEKGLRPNARRILAVRIDEVYAYDPHIRDPANVIELHDMRIACKRLRYLMEIFGVAFSADLDPFVDRVTILQDILGDIHDCDVQVPMLEEHLASLAGPTALGDQRVGVQALIDRRRSEREQFYERFLAEWRHMKLGRFRQRLEAALGVKR